MIPLTKKRTFTNDPRSATILQCLPNYPRRRMTDNTCEFHFKTVSVRTDLMPNLIQKANRTPTQKKTDAKETACNLNGRIQCQSIG